MKKNEMQFKMFCTIYKHIIYFVVR